MLPARSDEPVLDRATIERVLAENGHIVAQAARQLGMSRQALYRRMEKLGIKESPGARPKSYESDAVPHALALPADGPWPAGPRSGSAASRCWPCCLTLVGASVIAIAWLAGLAGRGWCSRRWSPGPARA